ncbi:MAG: RNA polymerase sigma factor RpoD/SigA [Termitinemataceae bacterium]|nr:MAG: RNA polymerase sigma factor RpoD/SigA [Termitinemataceae bacterium]
MNRKRKTRNSGEKVENVLAIYLKEINSIPLLSREDEDKIARAAANGDKQAFDKLVNANLRFVVNVAKRYQGHGIPLNDLISEGNIGLIKAVKRFDLARGCHFITYAVWWIRQSILKAIGEKSRMIRLPMNRTDELLHIIATRNELAPNENDDVSIKEIADTLGYEQQKVKDLLNISRDIMSLDAPVYSSVCSMGERIQDVTYKSPYEFAEQSIMQDEIEGALQSLDKREAEVIRCRFGIGAHSPMSLREIGDQFHLTKERIRQIEKKALRHLTSNKHKGKLQSYVA